MRQNRRWFLTALATTSVASLAGCSDSGSDASYPFQQMAKLAASDGDSEDRFGTSVAVASEGTTAIIGTPGDGTAAFMDDSTDSDDSPIGINHGSAYVFKRDDGDWTQQTKLIAEDGEMGDRFGDSVTISDDGTTALIGATGSVPYSGSSDRTGVAYVFDNAGGTWTQQATLVPDGALDESAFGGSLALSEDGTTAVIGAVEDGDVANERQGSAYAFELADGEWTQQARLTADDGEHQDRFGSSVTVATDGTTAIIGAYGDEGPNGDESGSAYVFQRAGGTWSQQSKLAADDSDESDRFGMSVAVSGDGTVAIIGATGKDNPEGEGSGSGYVFSRRDGTWTQRANFVAEDASKRYFGQSVAMSSTGTTAIVTAYAGDAQSEEGEESAHVFDGSDNEWSEQATLTAEDGDVGDRFGGSAALSADGTTVVVGAETDAEPNGKSGGSAYVFE